MTLNHWHKIRSPSKNIEQGQIQIVTHKMGLIPTREKNKGLFQFKIQVAYQYHY